MNHLLRHGKPYAIHVMDAKEIQPDSQWYGGRPYGDDVITLRMR